MEVVQDVPCKKKVREFLHKLRSLGYSVEEVSKRPQVYSIDNELVNVRCRGKTREDTEGKVFWYSVSFSVLQDVKWVLYLTTTSDYFVMLPSKFLESLEDDMYDDYGKDSTGIFNINWDGLAIELRDKMIGLMPYYHNLLEEECYPKF